MRSFIALLRREFWEHSMLIKVPLGLLLLVILSNLGAISWGWSAQNGLGWILNGIASVIYSIMQIVIVFYVLDVLYQERRDRSILFWKSLPVSDTKTVLSKLFIASVAIPAISFLIVLLAQAITLAIQGVEPQEMPQALNLWFEYLSQGMQQSVWFFPVVGWMLFSSSIARKSPFALAILLPLLVIFIDSVFRLDTGLSALLLERSPISASSVTNLTSGFSASNTGAIEFISNIKVQMGLLVGFGFTFTAILIRRRQGDELTS